VPSGPFLPVLPVVKYFAVYNLRFELFHDMEEVMGVSPTKFNQSPLSRAFTSEIQEAGVFQAPVRGCVGIYVLFSRFLDVKLVYI
jgi:hypothetical protein